MFIFPLISLAQSSKIKYYDADWSVCDSVNSVYSAVFTKLDINYKCLFYWTGTDTLAGYGTYLDTSTAMPIGNIVSYYKNGNLEDSSLYDSNNSLINAFHFYENKRLEVHYYLSKDKNEPVTRAFEENGKAIKDYVYAREAEFNGGNRAWNNYLLKSANKELKSPTSMDTLVSVRVLFCINEKGHPTKVKILKSSGIDYVDRDAIKVISLCPQWEHAVYLNKPVKVYRVQPFSYELLGKSGKENN